MPRRNGAASVNDAANAARQRFVDRLAPPLDDSGTGAEMDEADSDEAGSDEAVSHGAAQRGTVLGPTAQGGVDRGQNNNPEPLLPLLKGAAGAPGSADSDVESGLFSESGVHTRLRWRTPWRVAVLLTVPCLLLLLWFGWQSWTAQPTVEPLVRSSSARGTVSDSPSNDGAGQGSGIDGSGSNGGGVGQLTVHVAGAVKNPGIVRLPAGARVVDAIAAAGGAEPGAQLDSLNLAAVVEDAAKIHVPRIGEAVPGPDGGVSGGGAAARGGKPAGGKVNLNTATAEELDALPKVGPVLAKRIVEWRQQHGPFAAVEDLDAVDGVGPKMMEALLSLVTV
ncbi:helix-hairpin-helix domain-containing protein [Arthrobacter sp. NA-172]|uniref:helix-hairpin-helix domain-containing protein n=1 Tax=Arthrobacter sp. NA-172 TaxID=3367524 RepID=UPI00375427D4